MKLLLTILLFIPLPSFCQDSKYVFKLKEHIVPATGMFVAGLADGLQDYLSFRYNGNHKFWDTDISWRNKYKNGDPEQGERFFGSSTVFVGFTDGWHMAKLIKNVFTIGAVTFKVCTSDKKKWYVLLLEGAAYYILNRAGFLITYNLKP